MKKIAINTSKAEETIDITYKVQEIVKDSGVRSGFCIIFTLHTTCGLTITENADPDVKRDLLLGLGKISPDRIEYKHFEGNSPAHIKSSLLGVSLLVPIEDNRLVLGRWQGIYFVEFDGPRAGREVVVKVVAT